MNKPKAKYSAIDIAYFVIDYYNNRGVIISNLKLQKVLYFIQGNFYIKEKRPCFEDEIYAWAYGPVVPKIYTEFKAYGSNNIPALHKSSDCIEKALDTKISETDLSLIVRILELCKDYSAIDLVKITHNQTPWKAVYRDDCNNLISKEAMKEYFTNARK